MPTDRRAKAEWVVPPGEDGGAADGEIVLGEPAAHHGLGLKPARIIERLGTMGDARSVSLIVIHTHDIPHEFPDAALAEAERARGVPLGRRTDLRDLPLVTIDGEDARDFDDAVFAEPDGDGFRLIVAIADVAHYVPPGLGADHAAWTRGNTVLLPRPRGADAAGGAVQRLVQPAAATRIAAVCSSKCTSTPQGRKTAHRFGRGLMRSAARLTYEQVQQAHDRRRRPGLPIAVALCGVPRLAARRARRAARSTSICRNARWCWTTTGRVAAVAPRPRLDSHRLIEEFMVLANVAAAEELERLHQPCDVSRARAAVGREAGSRCAISCTGSASRCRRATRCIRAISTACCGGSPARRRRRWSTR